jgi:hypothetical protein
MPELNENALRRTILVSEGKRGSIPLGGDDELFFLLRLCPCALPSIVTESMTNNEDDQC